MMGYKVLVYENNHYGDEERTHRLRGVCNRR